MTEHRIPQRLAATECSQAETSIAHTQLNQGCGTSHTGGNGRPDFDHIRFSGERDLLNHLFTESCLHEIIDHLIESDQVQPYHEIVLAHQLQLTRVLAPRILSIFDEVREAIGFQEPVDLFVYPDASMNAVSLPRAKDNRPHLISLTNELVKQMNDAELRFVFGHELGHIVLGHNRVLLLYHLFMEDEQKRKQEDQQSRVPQLLERKLDRWSRLAELSADRVGFTACGHDLAVAVSVFFKMASGLGPEHLHFDVDGFLSQLQDLQSMPRREVLAQFSHPATPVRARSLQLYHAAGSLAADVEALAQVDAQVSELAALMDYEPTTELATHTRDFLAAAGLLAACADEVVNDREQEMLIRLLLPWTGDPEQHLMRLASEEQALAQLHRSTEWLRDHAGQERFDLLTQLSHIVAADGAISDGERAFMLKVASMLGIPERAARQTLNTVLSQYVQSNTKSGWLGFKLRS